jgi:hypothetical protein
MNINTAKLALQVLAVLHILVGLALPWLVELPQFGFYNRHLLAAFHTESAEALALGKFMVGILGPTVASWGLLFLFVVNVSFASRSRTGWYFMVIAITGWSLCDMYLSVRAGVYLNLLIDLVVLGLVLTPLVKVRYWFFSLPSAQSNSPAASIVASPD